MFFLPNIHLEICIYLNIFEESRKKLYKWKKTLLDFGRWLAHGFNGFDRTGGPDGLFYFNTEFQ